MSQTVLQLDNVEFRRNRRVIITDVNLTINAGERWVLFGPNGIGKSTAVGMLATRTFPSEGRVFILGHQLGKYDVLSCAPASVSPRPIWVASSPSSRTRWMPWSPACPP